MAENGGYDFNVAEGASHQCEICQLIMKEAVEIMCSHTFCDMCLRGWQNQQHSRRGKQFRCPVCNTLYQQHQLQRSGYLDRVIKYETPVKCKKHGTGCPWVGSIDDFIQSHEIQCGYQIITCEICRIQYMRSKLQEHRLDCLFECPNDGCNQMMKQMEINNHRENECLHEDVPCLHSVYGCDVMVRRGMIEEHQQYSWRQHLQLVQTHHNQFREKNGTLSVQLNEADLKIGQLERKLNKADLKIGQLERKLNVANLNIEQLTSSCLSADDRRKEWTFKELDDLLKSKSTRDKFNAIIACIPSLTKLRDDGNCTLLHMAAKYGATECVEVLIANGCDVKEKDEYGWMAIHFAASNNRTQVMKILLSHDPSSVNATTYSNWTPLHYAALSNQRETVEFLLSQPSVDVNARDVGGSTSDELTDDDQIKRMIRSHCNYSDSIDD